MRNKSSLSNIFTVMSANETIQKAKSLKDPKNLWDEFWIEDEVCCLFADANSGKSILAVQIGDYISNSKLGKNETVLYYDFELSKKQFEKRYTDSKASTVHQFNDRFIRVELNTDGVKEYCEENKIEFDDLIVRGIEENIKTYNSKVIIIDNISWLCNMKTTGNTAGKIMMKLCSLKKHYGISILVLAHTPKRNLGSPITQNSLSGSKAFTNFFDAMFAIGVSIKDPSIRYIKQIKVRSAAFKYGGDNVELCKIEKSDAFLGFKRIGFSSEKEQLSSKGSTTKQSVTENTIAKKVKNKNRKHLRVRSELADKQINGVQELAQKTFSKLTTFKK